MSLRAVWVVSLSKEKGKLLFNRTFPTVEVKAKELDGNKHAPLPSNDEFLKSLSDSLGLTGSQTDFNPARDGCQSQDQKPVFELVTQQGVLWPLLVMEQNGMLFCALPLVETGSTNRPPLIKIPGIAIGYTLLLGMAEFVGTVPRNVEPTHEKFADLYLYVGEAAPFGRPIDVNVQNIKSVFQTKVTKGQNQQVKEKQPAWRPNNYKGTQGIRFKVIEQIKAVQYDSRSIPDEWEVAGTVRCKAELTGNMPDVSVIIGYRNDIPGTQMDSLITHPCVQSADTQIIDSSSASGARPLARKIRFTPPLDSFTLCHYTANGLSELPIRGAYQMKGEKLVECLVQLQLSGRVKNNFEYCELQLPFYHRGPIIKVDANPNHGNVLLSPDKKKLVWNIGKKFPGKSLELMLKATVHFGHYDPKRHTKDDQFCTGNNAYALLFFKILDYSHSGVLIDSKSVQVSSATQCNIAADYEYTTKEYKIWNTHGDSIHSFRPPKDLIEK